MAKNKPSLPPDFVDLLAAFDRGDVRYLVVGGYAVGYHDRPRTTKDLDLLLDSKTENLARACRALLEYGAPVDLVAQLKAAGPDEVVWFGQPPLRIDFLKDVPGIAFDDVWPRRVTDTWSGVPVSLLSLDDLVQSKRASGREQDLIDARNLESRKRQGR